MKKHLLIYLIIYSICSLAGQVRAQERFADRYNITYVTMNEGLPHNFTMTCTKTAGDLCGFRLPEAGFPVMMAMSL